MITQGSLLYGRLYQFPGHKGNLTIQHLTSWPHSKWQHKCYHDDEVLLESVDCTFAAACVAKPRFWSHLEVLILSYLALYTDHDSNCTLYTHTETMYG